MPFSRLRIRVRFSSHAEHSQAVEGMSASDDNAPRWSETQIGQDTTYVLEAKDIYCEKVIGTQDHKEDGDYKEGAMWPVSS